MRSKQAEEEEKKAEMLRALEGCVIKVKQVCGVGYMHTVGSCVRQAASLSTRAQSQLARMWAIRVVQPVAVAS